MYDVVFLTIGILLLLVSHLLKDPAESAVVSIFAALSLMISAFHFFAFGDNYYIYGFFPSGLTIYALVNAILKAVSVLNVRRWWS